MKRFIISQIKAFVYALAVTIIVSGCSKNDNPAQTEPSTNTDSDIAAMQNFMAKHDSSTHIFEFNAEDGFSFKTRYGNLVSIPPHIFKKRNMNNVTGKIKFTFKEVCTPSDMIYADKTTFSNGFDILESFGMFQAIAVQGIDTLVIDNNRETGINIATTFPTLPPEGDIPLWDGDTIVSINYNGYNERNEHVSGSYFWSKPGVIWMSNGRNIDRGADSAYFTLFALNLWLNCDIFSNFPGQRTTLLCYMGDKFNDSTGTFSSGIDPSLLYFKPDNINGMIKLHVKITNAPESYKGLMSEQGVIPIGVSGKLLAMSHKGGKLYAELKSITIANTSSDYMGVSMNLAEVSESQLTQMIGSLNN